MTLQAQKKGPVHLRFDDGQVFVTPQDYDKFMIEARPALEALRLAVNVEEWVKNFFADYVPVLHRWCRVRADRIQACYVAFPTGRHSLKVIVVVTDAYDDGLGQEIAQLELELEDKGWPSDIMQLPATSSEDELQPFFKPEGSIQVYAKTEAASGKGR
jgi:hypothetical protein